MIRRRDRRKRRRRKKMIGWKERRERKKELHRFDRTSPEVHQTKRRGIGWATENVSSSNIPKSSTTMARLCGAGVA